MTEEEIEAINKGYFICPKCKQLSEKIYNLMDERYIMCTQCGAIIKEDSNCQYRKRWNKHELRKRGDEKD